MLRHGFGTEVRALRQIWGCGAEDISDDRTEERYSPLDQQASYDRLEPRTRKRRRDDGEDYTIQQDSLYEQDQIESFADSGQSHAEPRSRPSYTNVSPRSLRISDLLSPLPIPDVLPLVYPLESKVLQPYRAVLPGLSELNVDEEGRSSHGDSSMTQADDILRDGFKTLGGSLSKI